jgi:hypothetical protein
MQLKSAVSSPTIPMSKLPLKLLFILTKWQNINRECRERETVAVGGNGEDTLRRRSCNADWWRKISSFFHWLTDRSELSSVSCYTGREIAPRFPWQWRLICVKRKIPARLPDLNLARRILRQSFYWLTCHVVCARIKHYRGCVSSAPYTHSVSEWSVLGSWYKCNSI